MPPSSQSAPQPGKPGSEQTAAGQASPGQPGKSGGESPVNGSPGKPGNGHAKSPPNAEDLTVNEAKKLLAEEEERRKMRRRKKGRIRELEEMRAELAEKVSCPACSCATVRTQIYVDVCHADGCAGAQAVAVGLAFLHLFLSLAIAALMGPSGLLLVFHTPDADD